MEEDAHARLGLGLLLAAQEVLNERIVLVALVPLLEVFLAEVEALSGWLARADCLDDAQLDGDLVVRQNHALTDLALLQLVVVFENIGVVVRSRGTSHRGLA